MCLGVGYRDTYGKSKSNGSIRVSIRMYGCIYLLDRACVRWYNSFVLLTQGNFEHLVQITEPVATTPCPLPRTSSVQTLESLDMTRYSEDGEGLMAEKVCLYIFIFNPHQYFL